ncbi:hypothetical protein TERTU_0133 [Teredinibacter turnerae T7901]|uniref:Uncharacterized protein n=1 Tax=Teredinibacter turnerae (strain ATCC 39867 / T7901) TaxID=377629 RepID=C5BLB9_TERTT|nr:hypothetical protein TERTU_0133 [Teredinibacter turnerae T7901]
MSPILFAALALQAAKLPFYKHFFRPIKSWPIGQLSGVLIAPTVYIVPPELFVAYLIT